MTDRLSLDALGILEGTNKSSLLVDYLRHYERLFSDIRDDEMTIIEIGVHEGASMRMWYRFFSRATIVGVDVTEECRKYANDRVIIEIGSQSDLAILVELCAKYKPKIIIDDGSHQARDVLFTFQTLFPFLAPGGFYVMEDLYHHYGDMGKKFARDTPFLPADYIFDVARDLVSNSLDPARRYGLPAYLFDKVDRIEIIRNTITIAKKPAQDKERIANEWWALTSQSNRALNWSLLSRQLLRGGWPLDMAAEALRHCIDIEPDNLHHYYNLADVLDRLGKLREAIAAARRAVELSVTAENKNAAQHRLDHLTAKAM